MFEKIEAWLKNKDRDYTNGLALFQEASNNRSMFLYLARKNNMAKLVYELEKLATILPKKEIAKMEVKKQAKKQEPTPAANVKEDKPKGTKVNRDDLPEELQKVYDNVSEKYKLQRGAHEKMKLEELNDEQRAEARAEVVKLDEEIVAGWKQIDDYAGTTAAPALEKPHDPLAIGKEVNAARKYISSNLSKVATAEGTVKEELVKKLLERYQTLVNLKVDIDPETIDKLIKAGIIVKA